MYQRNKYEDKNKKNKKFRTSYTDQGKKLE